MVKACAKTLKQTHFYRVVQKTQKYTTSKGLVAVRYRMTRALVICKQDGYLGEQIIGFNRFKPVQRQKKIQ